MAGDEGKVRGWHFEVEDVLDGEYSCLIVRAILDCGVLVQVLLSLRPNRRPFSKIFCGVS